MRDQVHIYGLQEKGADEMRYVGQTVNDLEARLGAHRNVRTLETADKVAWVTETKRTGVPITLTLLCDTDRAHAPFAEQAVARRFRALGHRIIGQHNRVVGRPPRPHYALPADMHDVWWTMIGIGDRISEITTVMTSALTACPQGDPHAGPRSVLTDTQTVIALGVSGIARKADDALEVVRQAQSVIAAHSESDEECYTDCPECLRIEAYVGGIEREYGRR